MQSVAFFLSNPEGLAYMIKGLEKALGSLGAKRAITLLMNPISCRILHQEYLFYKDDNFYSLVAPVCFVYCSY